MSAAWADGASPIAVAAAKSIFFICIVPLCCLVVGAEPDRLHAALVDLCAELRRAAHPGGADRREVRRMAEEEGAVIADPVMERDRPSVVSAVKSGRVSPGSSGMMLPFNRLVTGYRAAPIRSVTLSPSL